MTTTETTGPWRRQKLLIGTGIAIAAFIAVVVLLVTLSNRIIEYGLRRALGENFRIERITVGWGTIEGENIRLLDQGRPIASVRKMTLRPNILAILRKTYAISRLVLDEPVFNLKLNENGTLELPFPVGPSEQKSENPNRSIPPVLIKKLIIRNGAVAYTDAGLKEPNTIEAHNINLDLQNFAFPFKDTNSEVDLGMALSGNLFSGSISLAGKINLASRALDLNCHLHNVSALNFAGSGPEIRVAEGRFKLFSQGATSNAITVSDVSLKAPFYRVETDRKGKVMTPGPLESRRVSKPDHKKTERTKLFLKNVKISDGELLYADGKIATPPHVTRLTAINLNLDQLRIPFDSISSTYDMSAKIPGKTTTGDLSINGKTVFKGLDTTAKVSVQNVDITNFKAYIEKKGDARVTRGNLDMTIDVGIRNRIIHAPARTVIRNLELEQGKGVGSKLMGIPRVVLVKFLETSHNRIEIDFTVDGDIDNPQFRFGETILRQMTIELARKIGVSIVGIGETAVSQGTKAIEGVGSGIKSMGESVRRFFR